MILPYLGDDLDSDSDSDDKKKKKKSNSKERKKEFVHRELMGLLMRINELDLTELGYQLIKYDRENRHLIKSKYCSSVNNIFNEKISINVILDIILKYLQRWLLHVNNSRVRLIAVLQKAFETDKVKGVIPIQQISGFIAMITCEIFEISKLKEYLIPLLENGKVNAHMFWVHMNKVFQKAVDDSVSLLVALNDGQLTAELDLAISKNEVVDNWMEDVFPHFDYASLMKQTNELAKYKKNMQMLNENESPYYKRQKIDTDRNYINRGDRRDRNDRNVRNIPPIVPNVSNPSAYGKKNFSNATKKLRRDMVADWIRSTPPKLKPQYQRKFDTTLCADYHHKELSCDQKDKSFCAFGRGTVKRYHYCVCGVRHPMHSCSKIWK